MYMMEIFAKIFPSYMFDTVVNRPLYLVTLGTKVLDFSLLGSNQHQCNCFFEESTKHRLY